MIMKKIEKLGQHGFAGVLIVGSLAAIAPQSTHAISLESEQFWSKPLTEQWSTERSYYIPVEIPKFRSGIISGMNRVLKSVSISFSGFLESKLEFENKNTKRIIMIGESPLYTSKTSISISAVDGDNNLIKELILLGNQIVNTQISSNSKAEFYPHPEKTKKIAKDMLPQEKIEPFDFDIDVESGVRDGKVENISINILNDYDDNLDEYPTYDSYFRNQKNFSFASSSRVTNFSMRVDYGYTSTPVPTPALLPGLVALAIRVGNKKYGNWFEKSAKRKK